MKRLWELNRKTQEAHVLRKGRQWEVNGKLGYVFEEKEEGGWTLQTPEGDCFQVDGIRDGRTLWLHIQGRTFRCAPHDWIGSESAEEGSNSGDVLAPMTGKITRIHVELGAKVSEGDLVAEMEAMKMQYSLKATRDGEVMEILGKEGEVLDVDAVVLRIEES